VDLGHEAVKDMGCALEKLVACHFTRRIVGLEEAHERSLSSFGVNGEIDSAFDNRSSKWEGLAGQDGEA
jgi:hypothetical protein